jgi:outer membrane protein TolC
MKNLIRMVITICLLSALIVEAQGATIDWDIIIALAREHNQDLMNAELSVKQAEIEYSRAVVNLYPQLSTSGGYSVSGINGGERSDNYSLGLSGSLPVFSGFRDITEVRIQRINKAIESENYLRILSDVYYNLKISYINLLASQEMLALWQDIQRQRTDNYNLVKLKYQAGREDRGSLLRMEADKLQADYELSAAKRDSAAAMLELFKNIGINPSDTIAVVGSLVTDTLFTPIIVDTALISVPEYRLAQLQLESANLKVRQSKSGYYPNVSVSSGYNWRGSTFPPGDGEWNIGLNVSYPLTGSLQNKYQVGSTRNSMAMAKNTFAKTALSIGATIQSARNDLMRAQESISITEKYLAASAEQSRITSRKYMNGLATYTEWYSVESDYVNAKKNMLSSSKSVNLLAAKLTNILGGRGIR